MKKLDEINEIMDEIKYGYVDINNEIHPKFDRDIQFKYRLQSPEELKKSKYGVCFDQVELQRALFKGYDFTTYFIVYLKESEKVHTHTFLVYTDNNKYFLYEHAEEDRRGIYEFSTLKDLLLEAAKLHVKSCIKDRGWSDLDYKKLFIYEYNKPKFGISGRDFILHCMNTKPIKINLKGVIENEKI